MKILVLTPINPVASIDVYPYLIEKFKKKEITILCLPFFAEVRSQMTEQDYVPTFFAMLKATLTKEMRELLYDNKNTIIIGNMYKEEKFDYVVALQVDRESPVFDNYIEIIRSTPELEELKRMVYVDELYELDDADIVLPTLGHLELFLEGVFK